ncbi:integrin alpha-4-like [Argonauta hians]
MLLLTVREASKTMCCFNIYTASRGHIFILRLSLLLYLLPSIYTFNVDTTHARVYKGDKGTYFGYSVALARLTSTTNNVLIGAPKDNYVKCKDSTANFEQTGVLYSCSPNTDNSCSEFCIHDLGTNIGLDSQNVSHAWLGAAIDIHPIKDEFVTCGHRWKSRDTDDNYIAHIYMNGLCTVNSFRGPTNHRLILLHGPNITASGTSVKYSRDGDEVIVGVPGKDNYASGIFLYSKQYNTFKNTDKLLVSNIDNSYAGYSVSSGKFFNDNIEYYVMGVPRDGSGAVIITDIHNNVKQYLKSESQEIGSYFGMKICVADVNNDKLDDLLVGAPMEPGDSREEGQVIVYISDGKKLQRKQIIYGGRAEGARFGSAITSLGDIDQDSFIDIAIGAPYENKQEGAIYIYNMNKEGFPSAYSQKITGTDAGMGKKLKGFGVSISQSVDVNNDNCLDFLVGSYISSQARLLFSRPVLDLKVALLSQTKKINFTKHNCPNYGTKAVCFKVILKFNYIQDNKQIPELIDLEGLLLTGSSSQPNTSRNLQTFGFKLESKKIYEKEFDIIEKDHPNIFQPIDVTIKMALAKISSCSICPILRTKTFLKKIPFELDCGNDDKCTTDLKVSASTSVAYLLYDKEEKFSVNVVVYNSKNHAYNSFIKFDFPKYLQYIQAIKDIVQPDFECSTDSEDKKDIVRCTLGNPLPRNTVNRFSLYFSSTGTNTEAVNSMNITVKTKSSESAKDLNNNKITVNIPNKMKASTSFNGHSNPELLSKEKRNVTVNHILVVYNNGPSPLIGVTLNITLPTLVKDRPDLIQRVCKNPKCPTLFSFGNISQGVKKQVDIVFIVNEKIHSQTMDIKYLETEAVLSRKDHPLYMTDSNPWPWKISVRTNFPTEAEPVALWIIILCILCGVFLLFLIVILFWRCGFFKRNKINPDEEQKSFTVNDKSKDAEQNNVPEKKTETEDDKFL